MPRVRSSNKGLEDTLNYLLQEVGINARKAGRTLSVGPGLRSQHGDDETLLLEATAGDGGGGDACRKWEATIRQKSGQYSLVVKSGTVNGVRPSNLNEPVTFNPSEINYVLCKVTSDATAGNVTVATIEVGTENKAGTQKDGEGAPPSPFYVLVGSLVKTTYHAELCYSVSATPVVTRTTNKKINSFGELPYVRWYRWDVRELSGG
jgi:hypothetical protein